MKVAEDNWEAELVDDVEVQVRYFNDDGEVEEQYVFPVEAMSIISLLQMKLIERRFRREFELAQNRDPYSLEL